jgi:hypothetical protein
LSVFVQALVVQMNAVEVDPVDCEVADLNSEAEADPKPDDPTPEPLVAAAVYTALAQGFAQCRASIEGSSAAKTDAADG